MLKKIISGGQTGADRAALDVGLERRFELGGWMPQGRAAEDGRIPDRYPGLVEAESSDPAVRTRWNVRDADATVIISHGPLIGGSRLTLEEARRQEKPALQLDLQLLDRAAATQQLRAWLAAVNPEVLNVAGPRASNDSTIYADVARLLRAVFGDASVGTDAGNDDVPSSIDFRRPAEAREGELRNGQAAVARGLLSKNCQRALSGEE